MCAQSQWASKIEEHAAPRLAKSAERIDGAMMAGGDMLMLTTRQGGEEGRSSDRVAVGRSNVSCRSVYQFNELFDMRMTHWWGSSSSRNCPLLRLVRVRAPHPCTWNLRLQVARNTALSWQDHRVDSFRGGLAIHFVSPVLATQSSLMRPVEVVVVWRAAQTLRSDELVSSSASSAPNRQL